MIINNTMTINSTINSLLEALIVIGPLLGSIAYVTIAERKIMGSMQRRIGPNRVGQQKINGLFQARYYHMSIIAYDNNNNNNNNNNKHPIVIVYNDINTDKIKILSDNKGKSGIYLFTHKESGKKYVGSAFDLSQRFSNYFNKNYLENNSKSMYIYKALLKHDYPAFTLSILEYVDITNLSLEESKNKILRIEQNFLDDIIPEYNILKIAGSLLGYKHTEESLIKRSGKNNHFFGKTHTKESKLKISNALIGNILSDETKAKMSLAKKGFIPHEETLGKLRKKVYLYEKDNKNIVFKEFESYTEAGKFLNCNVATISRNIDKDKVFKKEWILSSILINKS